MFYWVVEAVIAGEWSVAGLSVLAHTHTPPANQTSHWAKETTTPIIPLSPRRCCKHFRTSHLPFFIVAHPHASKKIPYVSRRGILFLFGLTQPREGAVSTVIRIFHREESGVFPSIFGIWCKSSFTHRFGGWFSFPIAICVRLPGGFIVENWLLFPHVVGCVCFTFWDCCRLFWSRFGHIGPRTTQELFPLEEIWGLKWAL